MQKPQHAAPHHLLNLLAPSRMTNPSSYVGCSELLQYCQGGPHRRIGIVKVRMQDRYVHPYLQEVS